MVDHPTPEAQHRPAAEPLLYPEPEARWRLGGISKRKMCQLIRDGEIPVVRIGRRIFFTPASLREFVAARAEGEQ